MPITNVVAFDVNAPGAGSVISAGRITAPHVGGTAYPLTVGGITLGTTDGGADLSILDSTAWVAGDSPLLRGRWRNDNTIGVRDLRIDTGNGALDFGLLSTVATFQRNRIRVFDGPTTGTVLLDLSTTWSGDAPPTWAAAGWDDWWHDFTTVGTDPTVRRAISSSDPIAVAFTRPITVTQGYITVRNGGHASGAFNSEISAIGWGAQGGGSGGGTPGLLYMQSQARMAGIHPY